MSAATAEFRVLGTLGAIGVDGASLPLGSTKQRVLLALLLARANEPVSVDRLIDAIWGEQPPASAEHAVQVYVSALRSVLGKDAIVRSGRTYTLRVAPEHLDLGRFEQLAREGRRLLHAGLPELASETLRAALLLWTGSPFADVVSSDGLGAEAERLEDFRIGLLEDLIEANLQLGLHAEVLAELQRLTAAHPLRERPCSQLMLALYRSGRQADALDFYRATRARLVEELGIEPSHELQALERAILRQEGSLHLTRPRRGDGKLPLLVTSFVGRGPELVALRELMLRPEVRLVTLTGPGGIGKTRLALEVAAALAGDYPDGAFAVELAALRDPGLLEETIAGTLGATANLAAHLGSKRLLLVLDNLEHLLEATPPIAGLLRACPSLDVLATSRERLRLSGENVYEVPPLREAEGVALFNERAAAAHYAFEPTGEIEEICGRLDGLPLAVELAAARTSQLSTHELLTRLDRRLPMLTAGARDAPERQQTLRATIEWSHDLLDREEKELFRRLGVFAGSWTPEAARDIVAADERRLESLAAKSLVRLTESRYSVLETLREYAVEKLEAAGEAEVLRSRHAQWFLALAETADAEMWGPKQRDWWERLDLELDNVRTALACLLAATEYELAARLATGLIRFWSGRGHYFEGRRWLDAALVSDGPLLPETRARALLGAGVLAALSGDGTAGLEFLEQSLAICRRLGDGRGAARAVDQIGVAHHQSGDCERAAEVYEEALAELEALGDDWGLANTLGHRGFAQISLGKAADAIRSFERCLELLETVGDPEMAEYAVSGLGMARLEAGHLGEASRRVLESLQMGVELGDRAGVVWNLEVLAAIAAERADAARAIRLLGAAVGLRERFALPRALVDSAFLEPYLARAGIDADEVGPSLPGRMSLAEAVEYAFGSNRAPAGASADRAHLGADVDLEPRAIGRDGR